MNYELSTTRDCIEYEASGESDRKKVGWNDSVMGGPLPALSDWEPPKLTRFRTEAGKVKGGNLYDLSGVAYSFLVSQAAVDALGSILTNDVLLYPVELQEKAQTYYLLVPKHTIDCIDRENSKGDVRKYGPLAGYFSTIDKLVIDEEALRGANLFMLPDSRMAVYVTETFKAAIANTNLTGFALKTSFWESDPWVSGR